MEEVMNEKVKYFSTKKSSSTLTRVVFNNHLLKPMFCFYFIFYCNSIRIAFIVLIQHILKIKVFPYSGFVGILF